MRKRLLMSEVQKFLEIELPQIEARTYSWSVDLDKLRPVPGRLSLRGLLLRSVHTRVSRTSVDSNASKPTAKKRPDIAHPSVAASKFPGQR